MGLGNQEIKTLALQFSFMFTVYMLLNVLFLVYLSNSQIRVANLLIIYSWN